MNSLKLTHRGVMIDLLDPKPEDIDRADIAHALAHLARFTGHGDGAYSVAQHCVGVAELARLDCEPRAVQAWCLLHDAEEAYLGDANSPLKAAMRDVARRDGRTMSDFDCITTRLRSAISLRFGVRIVDVSAWDHAAALLEVECNGPHSCDAHTWPEYRGPRPRLPGGVWPAELAEFLWLQRAGELGLL